MSSLTEVSHLCPPIPLVLPVADGSWELRILVTDLQVERTLRINGEMHIGALMIKLVDELDIAMDWSDHAMWWPEKNIWLDKTRWTLDGYNVTADAFLHFTPMHKAIRIQLPDLRYIDCTVNFAIKTFNTVINVCNELEIRHPEELSLCKPLEEEHLKFNYGEVKQAEEKKRRITLATMPSHSQRKENSNTNYDYTDRVLVDRPDTNTFIAHSSATLGRKTSTMSWAGSPTTLFRGNRGHGSMTLGRRSQHSFTINGTWRSTGNGNYTFYGKDGLSKSFPSRFGSEWSLAMSPPPSEEAKFSLLRPKNIVQRARMNVAWLDSSLSLMEQGIREFDTMLLRFKFYSFYDLNPKSDPVRINLIYEQAKWQILNGVIDCTEEEMMLFAALQLQVGLQANVPQPVELDEDDDLDAALTDLQLTLEGGHINSSTSCLNENLLTIPTLNDHLSYIRPKRFTLKGYKRGYFVLRELQLMIYRSKDDSLGIRKNPPSLSLSLKGCEVTPCVNIAHHKYTIKLAIPSSDGMSDLWIKCRSEEQYTNWLAGCRMAAKGKTLANAGFDAEVKSIQAFLSMQHPARQPVINPHTLDIQIEDYVAHRFLRKPKSKLRQKILESHANVKDLNLMEAKMNFIRAWQSLPDYGVSLFVVRFHGEKKDELLGIAFNRLMRMSIPFGDHVKTWRFNTIKAWNVNWETKHMMVQLGDGKNVIFRCLSADCKVVHEFIGGYIFLSMRSKELNQQLDEELFHKLTGGWQ